MNRKEKERLARDAAGTGPHIPQGVRLYRLEELDGWDVADGEADVRGWEVQTISGKLIGKVSDLLVDTTRGEVVLFDVDLAETNRHTLAPARAAQIDRPNKVVRLDSSDVPDAMPSLAKESWTDDEVRTFGDRYEKAYGDKGWEKDHDLVVGGHERDLRFARRGPEPEAVRPEREVRIEAVSEEGRAINRELEGVRRLRYRSDADISRP